MFDRCYRRYVDDIFCFTLDQNEAMNLLTILNNSHSSINFTLECPTNDNTLALLDFEIQIDNNRPIFKFYRKSARSKVMVNYRSALSNSNKRATLINEIKRIEDRCTRDHDKKIAIQDLQERLHANDYPKDFLKETLSRHKSTKHNRIDSNKHFNLQLPFISEAVDRRLNHVFKKYCLPVRVVHRSRTLRSAVQPSPLDAIKCTMKKCSIKHTGLCHRSNVVYEARCINCNSTYIGSTQRYLHLRVREHYLDKNSSVHKHIKTCPTEGFKFKIASTARDGTELALKEALIIQKRKPNLNSREEIALWEQNLL